MRFVPKALVLYSSTRYKVCAVLAMSTCQAWALEQVWAQLTHPDVGMSSALQRVILITIALIPDMLTALA